MKFKVNYLFVLFFLSTLAFFGTSTVQATTIGGFQAQGPAAGCTPACGWNEVCTAIGCISTSIDATGGSFFESIIRIAVGLGGGLALLLMLYGVFIITTSAGIPDKLKEGQEVITSAISGLIFIILSVFLLNLIGINILGIPGLS